MRLRRTGGASERRDAQKRSPYDLRARSWRQRSAPVVTSQRGPSRMSRFRDPELLAGLFEANRNFEFTTEDLAEARFGCRVSGRLPRTARRATIAHGGLSINDEDRAPEDAVGRRDRRPLPRRPNGQEELRIGGCAPEPSRSLDRHHRACTWREGVGASATAGGGASSCAAPEGGR